MFCPYFYSVPGRVFGFDKYLAPAAEERTEFRENPAGWVEGHIDRYVKELNWQRIIIILASVVIIIVLVVRFTQGGDI